MGSSLLDNARKVLTSRRESMLSFCSQSTITQEAFMVRRRPRQQEFDLRLPAGVVTAMRADLPRVAEQVVAAVIREVPSYSEPFRGRMGRNIEVAVGLALNGFLDAASRSGQGDAERIEMVFEAAYNLGRGEARSGRSMDALAAAYRVGARQAWGDMSTAAVEAGLPADELASFAGLVFDYIDQLSGVSVAGHADELAQSGRIRERQRAALGTALLAGRPLEQLEAAAEQAEWTLPRTLTAVLLPQSATSSVQATLDGRTLELSDVPALAPWPSYAVLLVPDVDGRSRNALFRSVGTGDAVIGPDRPWASVRDSFARALRALELALRDDGRPVDTEAHLADLVLQSDPEARADLRARVLAPLADLRPATAEKLTDTLRSWLLHHGRRDDIAAELFVHPQTVRYRVGQLREVYGDRLDDPAFVLDATIALA